MYFPVYGEMFVKHVENSFLVQTMKTPFVFKLCLSVHLVAV